MIRQSGPPVVTQPSMLTILRCLPMLFISVISERKLRRSSRLAFADKKNKFNEKLNISGVKTVTISLPPTMLSMTGSTSHYSENKLNYQGKIQFLYH